METLKNGTYVHESFPVLEMTCAACAASVESTLKAQAGVRDAGVNFASQTAWVEYDRAVTNPAELQKSVRSVGYDLVVNAEDPGAVQEESRRQQYMAIRNRAIWSLVLAAPVIAIGMFAMEGAMSRIISMLLTAPVVFYFGNRFFVNAWKLARHGRANMDTLVALSAGTAFLFSLFNTLLPQFWESRGIPAHVYYEASATIIAFVSLGKLLEERAKAGTNSAIRKLMAMQPKSVKVIVDGEEREVALAAVQPGDLIVVRPGEKIPVDGIVTEGTSYVDESMISGEPVPVVKEPGKKAFAGTLNQQGSFRLRAEKVGSETLLAHIIDTVRRAQDSKAPVQKLVDKVSGVFVPVVIAIACITFVIWMIAGGAGAFSHALLTSVTILVIACPCALGLATPTAIMVAIGKGAENNVLIRDAESLEQGHRVNAVVLDKTGTLTEGKPMVTDLHWADGEESAKHRAILYALASRSTHPLAAAIAERMKGEGSPDIEVGHFENLTSRGIAGSVRGERYFIGNPRIADEEHMIFPGDLRGHTQTLQARAKSVVLFSRGAHVLAVIGIADAVKPSAAPAVSTLRKRGIDVWMLTGDHEETARAVATTVGIPDYKAQVMPDDKEAFVRSLQKKGKVVAMVGDGINDSQALALADVSIAMGRGSDIAMDVASMTLITADLRAIPKALALSAKTVRVIRQNLFWAFIYNVIGIPLAAGILYPVNGFLLNPMIAAAAMALSSVSVVSNSLRLKLARLPAI